ncbi:hypothetical protein FBY12_3355 [Pseudomonas sp. SJZ131]|nr:hypothetical protein FBY12_3355 [Pseudomonas sp. SJZ131]
MDLFVLFKKLCNEKNIFLVAIALTFFEYSAIVRSETLKACGVIIPEVHGFQLNIKAESGVCYGDMVSRVKLSSDVWTEENAFIIEPVLFEKSLSDSGCFNSQGKYIYRYAVDDVMHQESEAEWVDFAHSSASVSTAVRVMMSPFMLWNSDEEISIAKKKFFQAKTGLWFDCFYGLKGMKGITVKFSACVHRSIEDFHQGYRNRFLATPWAMFYRPACNTRNRAYSAAGPRWSPGPRVKKSTATKRC